VFYGDTKEGKGTSRSSVVKKKKDTFGRRPAKGRRQHAESTERKFRVMVEKKGKGRQSGHQTSNPLLYARREKKRGCNLPSIMTDSPLADGEAQEGQSARPQSTWA